MLDYFIFWISKGLAEIAFALSVAIFFLLLGFLIWLPSWIRQIRCKHQDVYENRRCHAICRKCSKDLGFIQTWRDAHRNDNKYREL